MENPSWTLFSFQTVKKPEQRSSIHSIPSSSVSGKKGKRPVGQRKIRLNVTHRQTSSSVLCLPESSRSQGMCVCLCVIWCLCIYVCETNCYVHWYQNELHLTEPWWQRESYVIVNEKETSHLLTETLIIGNRQEWLKARLCQGSLAQVKMNRWSGQETAQRAGAHALHTGIQGLIPSIAWSPQASCWEWLPLQINEQVALEIHA